MSVKVALFSSLMRSTCCVVRAGAVRKQERLIRFGPSGKPYTPAPQAPARDSYVEAPVSFSIAVSGAATYVGQGGSAEQRLVPQETAVVEEMMGVLAQGSGGT